MKFVYFMIVVLAGAFNRKSKWMLQERLVAVCVLTVIKIGDSYVLHVS